MKRHQRLESSVCHSGGAAAGFGHARAPRRIAAVALAMLLATSSLLTVPQNLPFSAERVAAQANCAATGDTSEVPANWGAAAPTVCAWDGAAVAKTMNWGAEQEAISSTIGLTPTSAPVVAFDQSVGQAAGEIGAPSVQLVRVCSSPPCTTTSANQNVSILGVCSSPPCNTDALSIPGICSSPPCGSTTPVVPTGICSRPPCQTPTASASVTPASQVPRPKLDPKWATVEQWVPDILTAQQQVFTELGVLVPTNVVMAEMMIETQGVMPDGPNSAGAEGLLQITPYSFGADRYDFDRMNKDPAYSIYCGIYDLALRYNDSKSYNKDSPGQPLPWANVIVGFFSGHYFPNGADDGYNSDFQYQNAFIAYFNELEAAGGAWTGGSAGDLTRHAVIPGNWLAGVGQTIQGLNLMWTADLKNAGETPPLTQEFGPTDFSINVHPDWYTYSLAYGFAQPGHTGLDVGIPAGTPLFAPTDGVIYCAGTGNPGFPAEEGCAAFASAAGGPTSGRLQIQLSNKDMLIYGHVNQSVVPPGARVVRGQLVGYSGGINGDHVHVEYRVPDPTTDAQWRIIDPRLTPLNGLPIPVVAITVTTTPKSTTTPNVLPTATTDGIVVPTDVPTDVPTTAATEAPTEAPTLAPPTEVPPTTPPDVPTEPPPQAPTVVGGAGPPAGTTG